MLNMAVGERKIGALIVTIGGHVPPFIRRGKRKRRVSRIPELPVKDRVFIFVNENKPSGGMRGFE